MSAEDDNLALGDLVDVLHKADASLAESVDHMLVVDDLVIDIDVLTGAEIEKLLDHIDGHVDPGTETSWIGENDPHVLFPWWKPASAGVDVYTLGLDGLPLCGVYPHRHRPLYFVCKAHFRRFGWLTMTVTTLKPMNLLEEYGPDSARPGATEGEARAYVTALTTEHYENFSVLSRLVPERLRPDFASVYAYCRWADDLGDETGRDDEAKQRSLDLLGWWRRELDACFRYAEGGDSADSPRHPVFVALVDSIRRRGLPKRPFEDLITAFEQDQRITRYRTWGELIEYCANSANPVGRLVLAIGGYDMSNPAHSELFRMSDATCTALQLTNFWQDVRRDLFERDRIYLPAEETGITADELDQWARDPRGAKPEDRVRYIKAIRHLCDRTERLFEEGRELPKALDNELSPVVWLFGAGGEAVLGSVLRIGCTTLWRRPRLTTMDKLRLLLAASIRFRSQRARRCPAT